MNGFVIKRIISCFIFLTLAGTFLISNYESRQVILVGDSMIAYFPTGEIFHNPFIRNKGIAGITSKQLLQIIGEKISTKPQKIIIEVGINDLGQQISFDTTLHNINQVCNKIHIISPETKIFILSIFPVLIHNKPLPWIKNMLIAQANLRLQKFAQREGVIFINIFEKFYNGKELYPRLTSDGVHLNTKGYYYLGSILRNVVTPEI